MIPAQRQSTILNLLTQKDVVSFAELTAMLHVSHMTVRRDIHSLEDEGRVVLVSGGVRLSEHIEIEPSHKVKATLQAGEKMQIAKAAAKLVPPDSTVYLDAGTTCLAIAKELAPRNDITVLTNDFTVTAYLIEHSQCKLYHTGGHVLRKNESCIGDITAKFIAALNIDFGFISASSWDIHYISTPTESKVPVKKAVVASSTKRILVSDATKYGKVGFFKAIPLKDIDTLITDPGLDRHVVKALSALGIAVIIAT